MWDPDTETENLHCNFAQPTDWNVNFRRILIASDDYHGRPGLTVLGFTSKRSKNNDNSTVLKPFYLFKVIINTFPFITI